MRNMITIKVMMSMMMMMMTGVVMGWDEKTKN